MTPTEAKNIAIKRAGGSTKMAPFLGVTRQAIDQWPHVPAKHVLTVEALSGVSRYTLRPDIYGEPPGGFLAQPPNLAAA